MFDVIENMLQATVRLSTPFILAAMGGIFSDKAGVSSIELESYLLIGAFAGFTGAYFTGSLFLGVLIACVVTAVCSLIYGYLVVGLGCRSAVVGMAMILFATGATNYFNRAIFGTAQGVVRTDSFQTIRIPVLSEIPFIGPILFQQNILVYVAFLFVILTWLFFKKFYVGLEWRAAGENPFASDTVGIPVRRIRYLGVILTGAIAAIAGAYLSMASSNVCVEKMSSEKGYAAFSIIILGKYHPVGAMFGCLLFGFADALQLNMQALGVEIPNQFLLMLPYLFTLVVLFISGKGKAPEGHNKYFQKGMNV